MSEWVTIDSSSDEDSFTELLEFFRREAEAKEQMNIEEPVKKLGCCKKIINIIIRNTHAIVNTNVWSSI